MKKNENTNESTKQDSNGDLANVRRSASINVANNVVNGYYVSTAMWATYIMATGLRHPTYETFVWLWDKKELKRGELIKQYYHAGYRNTALNFHFRFCRTLAWRQLKKNMPNDNAYVEMDEHYA